VVRHRQHLDVEPVDHAHRLSPGGTLTLYNGAVDIGQGSNTIMVQIAADALGLPAAQFALVTGDTDLTADAGKTSASRQTFVSGKAAEKAARICASRSCGWPMPVPTRCCRSMAQRCRVRRARGADDRSGDDAGPLMGEGTFDPPTTPLDADGQGVPYATYGFAAQMAEVEVDLELGTVKVLRIVAAHDVGRAINPMLVEGQIQGGIAQGLGLALMEEYIPGRTENLHDYLIPTVGDMPRSIVDPDRGSRAARSRSAPRASASRPWCRRRPPSSGRPSRDRCARPSCPAVAAPPA
jgi:aldehyde oxidoreductase